MKYGIIGGGPSGLAMSLFLRGSSEVLEKEAQAGGHTGSWTDAGYTFDHGPHILFSKNQEILDWLVHLLGTNVSRRRRHNVISYKGRLIRYPFENDLASLPLQDRYECLASYLMNPYATQYQSPKDLRQWLLKTFGTGLCEKYLFPYNEKVWNLPVEKLSMVWADRIPQPPAEDVIKSALGYQTEGYLHQLYYYYPRRGGYGAICEALSKHVPHIRYQFKVSSIRPSPDGGWKVSNGRETFEYDQLIATLPLPELLRVLRPSPPRAVRQAIRKLMINPMLVVSLGIAGKDDKKFTAVYFPEPDFYPNRICFPGTFSPHNVPRGHYSIQADITCRPGSSIWKKTDKTLINHVVRGLAKRALLNPKRVVYSSVRRIPYAYVVYDRNYEKRAQLVRRYFAKQKIHLVGRFAYFEYINTDGAIARALETASQLNRRPVHLRGTDVYT